jgi:hypothetical protein
MTKSDTDSFVSTLSDSVPSPVISTRRRRQPPFRARVRSRTCSESSPLLRRPAKRARLDRNSESDVVDLRARVSPDGHNDTAKQNLCELIRLCDQDEDEMADVHANGLEDPEMDVHGAAMDAEPLFDLSREPDTASAPTSVSGLISYGKDCLIKKDVTEKQIGKLEDYAVFKSLILGGVKFDALRNGPANMIGVNDTFQEQWNDTLDQCGQLLQQTYLTRMRLVADNEKTKGNDAVNSKLENLVAAGKTRDEARELGREWQIKMRQNAVQQIESRMKGFQLSIDRAKARDDGDTGSLMLDEGDSTMMRARSGSFGNMRGRGGTPRRARAPRRGGVGQRAGQANYPRGGGGGYGNSGSRGFSSGYRGYSGGHNAAFRGAARGNGGS